MSAYTIVAQVAPNGLWGSSVNSAPSAVVDSLGAVGIAGELGSAGDLGHGSGWAVVVRLERLVVADADELCLCVASL